jgi:hypothetical protein
MQQIGGSGVELVLIEKCAETVISPGVRKTVPSQPKCILGCTTLLFSPNAAAVSARDKKKQFARKSKAVIAFRVLFVSHWRQPFTTADFGDLPITMHAESAFFIYLLTTAEG